MRKREKLTPEERFALALALVKREQSLAEICLHYQVSHTTAYKLRNAFLDGARQALAGGRGRTAEGARDERDDDLVGPDGAGDLVAPEAAGDAAASRRSDEARAGAPARAPALCALPPRRPTGILTTTRF